MHFFLKATSSPRPTFAQLRGYLERNDSVYTVLKSPLAKKRNEMVKIHKFGTAARKGFSRHRMLFVSFVCYYCRFWPAREGLRSLLIYLALAAFIAHPSRSSPH